MSSLGFWIIELTLVFNILITFMVWKFLVSLSGYELEENGKTE